jgi:transposase
LVDGLDGSDSAKRWLRAILGTLVGEKTVGAAGEEMGVGEAMFHRMKARALQGALEALEPKRAGRPRVVATEEERQIGELRAEVGRLQVELEGSRVRELLAVTMPHVLRNGESAAKKAEEAVVGRPGEMGTGTVPVGAGERRARRHLKCLNLACRLRGREKKPRAANGLMIQEEDRRHEREVRKTAVAFVRWARTCHGWTEKEAAERLDVSSSTLRSWKVNWEFCKLKAYARGARPQRPDQKTRTMALALFHAMGPGVGVPTLEEMLPNVGRTALENLLRRYQRMRRKRKRRLMYQVRWRRMNRVWAMDYFQAPVPIEGRYPWCLVVRDLASGRTLMALPALHAMALATRLVLLHLFACHGAPLVIKCDNGSHFTADSVMTLLQANGVNPLLSPAGLPEYNGAIEAGIGSLKTRAHYLSMRSGRPGEWTLDDIDGARSMGNETGRPWGLSGRPGLADQNADRPGRARGVPRRGSCDESLGHDGTRLPLPPPHRPQDAAGDRAHGRRSCPDQPRLPGYPEEPHSSTPGCCPGSVDSTAGTGGSP